MKNKYFNLLCLQNHFHYIICIHNKHTIRIHYKYTCQIIICIKYKSVHIYDVTISCNMHHIHKDNKTSYAHYAYAVYMLYIHHTPLYIRHIIYRVNNIYRQGVYGGGWMRGGTSSEAGYLWFLIYIK